MAKWVSQIVIKNQCDRTLHLKEAKIPWGEKEFDDGKFPVNIDPGETGIYEVYSPAGTPSGIEFYLTFHDIVPKGQAQYGTMKIFVDIPFRKHANNGGCVTNGSLFTTGFGRIPNGVHNFNTAVTVHGPNDPRAKLNRVSLASQHACKQLYPKVLVLDYLLIDYDCKLDGNTYVLGICHNGQIINRVRLNPRKRQYKHAVLDSGEYEVYIEKEWKQKSEGFSVVVPNRIPCVSLIGRLNLSIGSYPDSVDVSDLQIKPEILVPLRNLQDVCGGFFAVQEMSAELGTDGYVKRIHFSYCMDCFTFQRVQKKVENIANSISGDSVVLVDIEKAVRLFDWFTCNSHYVEKPGDDAYDFFQKGQALCSGVTKAFELVAKHLGLNVIIIRNKETDHAWNMVEVDGQWYHADPFLTHNASARSHYFLKSDDLFQLSHTKSKTPCWDSCNYAAPKSGNNFDSFNDASFQKIVAYYDEVPLYGYLNVDKLRCSLGESVSLTVGMACTNKKFYESTYNRDYQLHIDYFNEKGETVSFMELVKYDTIFSFKPACASTYHVHLSYRIGDAMISSEIIDVLVTPTADCK